MQGIAALPGVGALLLYLGQVFRDQIAHDRKVELGRRKEIFNIGATSHMANVAFDKHVKFCEKYISEIHDMSLTLFREGPTTKAIKHEQEFHKLRQQYAAWLTEEINKALLPFEYKLRKLAANELAANAIASNPGSRSDSHKKRVKYIEESYEAFKEIIPGLGGERNPESDTEKVTKQVRKILNVDELLQLRKHLIDEASKAISEPDKV